MASALQCGGSGGPPRTPVTLGCDDGPGPHSWPWDSSAQSDLTFVPLRASKCGMVPRLWPALAALLLLLSGTLRGDPVAVRFSEGLVHGFLVLLGPEGNVLAEGALLQFARGDLVTNRLTFHFRDGSLHDETTVFSQKKVFRLISDHLLQGAIVSASAGG